MSHDGTKWVREKPSSWKMWVRMNECHFNGSWEFNLTFTKTTIVVVQDNFLILVKNISFYKQEIYLTAKHLWNIINNRENLISTISMVINLKAVKKKVIA